MKRIFSLILTLVLLLSFTACNGNFANVNLGEPVAIPKNGIIEKSVLDKIKTDNTIATFFGESGDMKYEWKIFGKELEKTKDVNLSVDLEKTQKCIKVSFNETEEFAFSALLSIYINEKWNADSATAYSENKAVASVSITGADTTILNVSVDKLYHVLEILPDKKVDEDNDASTDTTTENSSTNDASTNGDDASSTPSSKPSSSGKPSTTSKPTSSNTTSSEKDKYQTYPVPEEKPTPVEPDDSEVNNKKKYTCTFSIECSTILNNLSSLDSNKLELIPSNGLILAPVKVTFYEGESVFDVLQRVCKEKGVHLESSWTPIYNSAYIEGINNIYEFDCGELSGWMYRVNGWYPNYGCSRYELKDGDVVEWRYTCDLGKDVGEEWMGQ